MNTNKNGFVSIVLILALVVILAGGFGYFELIQRPSTTTVTTTEQTPAQQQSTTESNVVENSKLLDNRCITKAVGTGLCMAIFRAVEFNQSTKKCEYVDVGGCSVTSPFNETTYQDSDKEMRMCQSVCEI